MCAALSTNTFFFNFIYFLISGTYYWGQKLGGEGKEKKGIGIGGGGGGGTGHHICLAKWRIEEQRHTHKKETDIPTKG